MKYLGIDFGLKRIGLAVSEGDLASPFKTIQVSGPRDGLKKTLEIVQKENVEKIIVGLPEGKIGNTVLGFIKALKKAGLDVESSDETLSSKKAISKMIELNIPKEKRKKSDDIAAAIILQDWLDNQ